MSSSPARRLAIIATGGLALLASSSPAMAARPLETAVADAGPFNVPAEIPHAFQKVRAAGASAVRVYVSWRGIAPVERPASFSPADPMDPAYDWDLLDYQVRVAAQNNLDPILSIEYAPAWAEGRGDGPAGTVRPDPAAFGLFAKAVARRYSGRFDGLPRVRYWQAWNEPNYFRHLSPQYDTPLSEPVRRDSDLISPAIYRRLVNAFAKAVHNVRRDNLVIAGALAPFGNERANTHVARTMPFMRALLCMNERDRPKKGCNERTRFDAWSHHPYTSGGPTHKAITPLDVSLGDLPRMRRLLNRAIRAGHITSRRRPAFWVTEFSWDTDPPDENAVPMKLHKRWVAHALYQMWRNGVSLATWFQIRDAEAPIAGEHTFESGLYFRCDPISCIKPKPSRQAFRFPFVAFRSGKTAKVAVWGRTPWSRPGPVSVEQKRSNGKWRRLVLLRANRHGIFRRTVRTRAKGLMRARLARGSREKSLAFSLKRVPDRRVNPFG